MSAKEWTFLTSHGLMLCAIAKEPDATLKTLAEAVGISERAATTIVGDLVRARYVTKQRVGRRNRYRVVATKRFRHELSREIAVGDLLALLQPAGG